MSFSRVLCAAAALAAQLAALQPTLPLLSIRHWWCARGRPLQLGQAFGGAALCQQPLARDCWKLGQHCSPIHVSSSQRGHCFPAPYASCFPCPPLSSASWGHLPNKLLTLGASGALGTQASTFRAWRVLCGPSPQDSLQRLSLLSCQCSSFTSQANGDPRQAHRMTFRVSGTVLGHTSPFLGTAPWGLGKPACSSQMVPPPLTCGGFGPRHCYWGLGPPWPDLLPDAGTPRLPTFQPH